MKASDSLFRLIKSLNKSEKGYFKKFSSLHTKNGGRIYVRLFDAIARLRKYDEEKLYFLFDSRKPLKQLSDTKNYLFDILLKSLQSYHSSMDVTFHNLLQRIEVLYEKGLYKECNKILLKAKKAGLIYENHFVVLQLLRWEEKIMIVSTDTRKLEKEILAISEERRKILEKENNITEYRKLSSKVSLWLSKKGKNIRNAAELNEFEEIMKNPLLNDEKRALSIEAKGYFYHIHGIYYYIKRDFNNSFTYFDKLRELQEKWQHILEGQNYRYIYVLEHLMLIYSALKKFDQHRSTLAKLREITAKSRNDKARIFVISYQRELDMYINSGEFEKGIVLIPDIEKGLEEFEDIIDEANKSLLFFNIACICHGATKYRQALVWVNKILNNSSMVREDIYSYTHILNLIIHYELGNIDLLEYRIKTAREFLQKKKRLYKFETLVLTFIKKLCASNEKEDQAEACKKLKNQLINLFTDPYEKIVLEYFDFISWLESKIENRSFAEAIKIKAKQK